MRTLKNASAEVLIAAACVAGGIFPCLLVECLKSGVHLTIDLYDWLLFLLVILVKKKEGKCSLWFS